MDSKSLLLTVPLTLPAATTVPLENAESPHTSNLIEESCTESKARVLVSWGLATSEPAEGRGAILGCEDGSLYVFQPPFRTRLHLTESVHSPPHSQRNSFVADSDLLSPPLTPTHRARRHSRGSRSSSSSFAMHQATFNVTSRSRAVSGLSKEQVEAPKNYVEFEDEPEKLKELLKGKGAPRDKTGADNLAGKGLVLEKLSRPASPAQLQTTGPASKRKNEARSLLSATNSPPFSPSPPSTPSSPLLMPLNSGVSVDPYRLSLRYHIIPNQPGAISAVHILDDRLFVILQESGNVYVFKTRDGTCLAVADASNVDLRSASNNKTKPDAPEEKWIWKRLFVVGSGEITILLASAAFDGLQLASEKESIQERTHVVAFELFPGDDQGSYKSKLDVLGHWFVDGNVEGIEFYRDSDDDSLSFAFLKVTGHLVTQRIRILPRAPLLLPALLPSRTSTPNTESSSSHNLPHIPLPNPFKTVKHKSSDNVLSLVDAGRVVLDGEVVVGSGGLGVVGLLRIRRVGDELRGIVWNTEGEIVVFGCHEKVIKYLNKSPSLLVGIRDVKWVDDDSYAVVFEGRVELYETRVVDLNNNPVDFSGERHSNNSTLWFEMIHTFKTGIYQALEVTSPFAVMMTSIDKIHRRVLRSVSRTDVINIWKSLHKSKNDSCGVRLTSMLPLELNEFILGYDDGSVRRSTFARMSAQKGLPGDLPVTNEPLNGYITTLHVVQIGGTTKKLIVGGADDGSLAFWSSDSLELQARWTVFTTPLKHVAQFQDNSMGPFNGCILCVSEDGTVAVIVIDGLQFLHLVPGSVAPLRRLCIGGHNMLLIYADGRVRLWDIQTTEFWRSTNIEKAEELLAQGGWTELSLRDNDSLSSIGMLRLARSYNGKDALSTILFDLERFLSVSTLSLKALEAVQRTSVSLDIRHVLSALLTPGLNDDIDMICRNRLSISESCGSPGVASSQSSTLFHTTHSQDAWCISPEASAARALSIIATLRVLGLVEDVLDDCNTVIAFYATSLHHLVGADYQPPRLASLARHWFESSNELRQAARLLVDAGIARMSEEETTILAEQWQHDLPCLQPDVDKESTIAAMSLFLCGYMASEKYSLLSTSTLIDISKSIAMYLHDEKSLYRALAIDLCSRGFHIWQHYVDAMEMLRALFILATNSRKDSISSQNVGPQARLAVLQIAASNTPLFMTTLGLDISHPRGTEHRKSTMQLVAFLIRKRPMVLYPNLPRLMEAVVKSLDPNSTKDRDAVLDAATEILGHVVKTFPTVDFYMSSQRLAVGTSEGAIVMYDLKTGTRLYILEGHKKRPAACSFSPDGRRLVTVSLEEGVVLVWKVGSSFSSFFNPGAPPRQGHRGSEPFKTLAFNVGDEANMSVAGTLEFVRFEWTAERSVKLKIRDSTLTFRLNVALGGAMESSLVVFPTHPSSSTPQVARL